MMLMKYMLSDNCAAACRYWGNW